MNMVAIIIVGYDNPRDVVDCLSALAKANDRVTFDVFICENAGDAAFDRLIDRLSAEDSPCRLTPDEAPVWPVGSVKHAAFALNGTEKRNVFVAAATENLGYSGGINAWLRPLATVEGWRACWILNPDTIPDPAALSELERRARESGKGMVGSRIESMDRPGIVATRGLRWRTWHAKAAAVDRQMPANARPDQDHLERTMTAPSGASVFVTRELLDRIGLMEDSYFLYFEDLEWGSRASRIGALSYAHDSIVRHAQGTTIGSSASLKGQSPLSVYLNFRNTIHFVRRNHPMWLAWTVPMLLVHAARYLAHGASDNFAIALRGIAAGISGETGRPVPMPSARSQAAKPR